MYNIGVNLSNEYNTPERKFNPSEFANLVRLVIGAKTIQAFCEASGLSRSFVSRAINCKCNQPTKRILFKILTAANEECPITLNQLLEVAGYEPIQELPDRNSKIKVKVHRTKLNSFVITSDDLEDICTNLKIVSEAKYKYPVVILTKHLDTCVSLREIIKRYNIDIQIALLLD